MKKRLLATLLALCLIVGLFPAMALADGVEGDKKGTCGATGNEDKVTWALTENGTDSNGDATYTLTISGEGDMANLNKSTDTESIADGAGTYPWAGWKGSITTIVIEDGVTSIGSKAFIGYTNVTSVTIGKDVSEIGVGALSQLSACTSFDVSGNTHFTTDDTGALFDRAKTKLIAFPCGSSATEYTVPATVTTIAYGAFSRAATLVTVTIPEGSQLETIGYGAFAFTTALETVNLIPASIKTVGDLPFTQSGVKHIYCADETAKALIQGKVDGLLIDVLLSDETPAIEFTDNGYTYRVDDGEALVVSAPKNEATPTIPSKVTYEGTEYPVTGIWKGAFAISMKWEEANGSADKRNEAITSVTLPDSIMQIGERAFYFCTNLATITIQTSKLAIDDLAFATQNSNGTTLDFSAVTQLQINGTGKWVGVSKVILNNEGQLDTIKANVRADTVAVVGNDEWKMTSGGTWAKQPKTGLTAIVDGITWTFDELDGKASLTAYSPKTTETENVTVPSTLTVDGATYTVTALGRGLFGWTGLYDDTNGFNTSIKSVVIPETVATIGADMFRYSSNLENVTIQGESITFESNRTFSGTSKLKTLDMSSVKTVSFEADGTGYFSNIKGNAVIYVASDTVKSALTGHGVDASKVIFVVTNGGTVDPSGTGLAAVSKAGYDVTWTTDGTEVNNPESATLTAGKTYTATWTLAEGNVEITYAPNISDNDENVVLVAVKDVETPVAGELFSRTGYTFAGWNTADDGNGTAYRPGDTINKADTMTLYAQWTLNAPVVSTNGPISKTYDGNGVTLNVVATHELTGLTYTYQWKKAEENIEGATNSDYALTGNVSDSGTYTCVVTAADSGSRTASAEVTINVTITNAAIPGITVLGYTGEYDGDTHTVSYTIPEGAEIQFKVDGASDYTTTAPSFTDVGSHSVEYKVSKANYDDVTGSVTVDITKATPTISISADKASLPGGGLVTLTVDKSGLPDGAKVTVTCNDTNYTPIPGADGTYTVSLPNSNAAYTFTASYAGDENHETASATCTVTVTMSYPVVPPVNPTTPSKPTKPDEPDQPDTPGIPGALPFVDVGTGDWFYEDVAYVYAQGIMTGSTASTFAPNDAMTRAMVWTVLGRMSGENVEGGTPWYAAAQAWAVSDGVSDGKEPNSSITREQLVTMLYRQAGSPEVGVSELALLGRFTDGESVSSWAEEAMAWAVAQGVLTGDGDLLNPQATATRAQVAAILARFCENIQK